MKRMNRPVAGAQLLLRLRYFQGPNAGAKGLGESLQQFLAFQLAFLVVVASEEGGDDQVAGEADQVQAFVGDRQLLLLDTASLGPWAGSL